MQTKGRIMLMVIAGGYLAYLGGGLVTDAMNRTGLKEQADKQPNRRIIFCIQS